MDRRDAEDFEVVGAGQSIKQSKGVVDIAEPDADCRVGIDDQGVRHRPPLLSTRATSLV